MNDNHKDELTLSCPYRRKCGGCQYQGMTNRRQLSLKMRDLTALLQKYGEVSPILGMDDPIGCRHKVHAVFGFSKGRTHSGTYKEGTHTIVDIDKCLIDDPLSDEIIMTIRGLLRSFKISVYDEDSGRGLLRHVMIRSGRQTGQYMVILVVTSPIFPSKNNFVKALRKAHPEITTVVLNINDADTSMVLGERSITLYGKGYITDRLLGLSFAISPTAFFQVNPQQTEVLYQTAMDFAALTGRESVIDAYCGIGTISLIAAKKAGQVMGIELNGSAVKDAIGNAKYNKIGNARFIHDDATRFMQTRAEEGMKADVIFMDPPRSGATPAFIDAAAGMNPSRIVYISCNPETLARDLKRFEDRRYKVRKMQPVDMFPFAKHCEVVTLLTK